MATKKKQPKSKLSEGIISVNIGGKTFTGAQINDPAYEERIRRAVVNRRAGESIIADTGRGKFNVETNQQVGTSPQAPGFNRDRFIQDYTGAGQESIVANQRARNAMIRARQEQQLGDLAGAERDVEQQYEEQRKGIGQDVYQAQERQRALGTQRGIQYSPQQQAIEAGIQRTGTELQQEARVSRQNRLANIKDKISAIRKGTALELEASQATAQAQQAQLRGQAEQMATQRQWQLEDRDAKIQREDFLRQEGYNRQDILADRAFNRQLEMYDMQQKDKERFFNMDADLKREFSQMSQEFQKEMFEMSDKSKEKFFNMDTERQKNMFELQQQGRIDLQAMSNAQQQKMFELSSAHQRDMAEYNTAVQKELLDLRSKDREKFFELETDAKRQFAMLNFANQVDIMKQQQNFSEKQLQTKIQAQANSQAVDTMKQYILNNPKFSAYPETQGFLTRRFDDTQLRLLTDYFSLNNVPKEKQAELIQGQYDPNFWDRLFWRGNQPTNQLKDLLKLSE